jgi:cytochrome c heme-lyase
MSSGCPVRGSGIPGAPPAANPLADVAEGASGAVSGCPVRGGRRDQLDPLNKMKPGGEKNLPAPMQSRPLDTTRANSTILKGAYTPDHQEPKENNPVWEYPSPQMFFNAMRRKGHNPNEEDMATVVAIHNAVNERAWMEVMKWEAVHSSKCGQPSLVRFEGRPQDVSPRARMLGWMGYSPPFDRHDWVVDRCGARRNVLCHRLG